MNLLSHRRDLMSTQVMTIKNITVLPKTYQEVEFLENTGIQYIDTDYIPNNNMSIDIVYKAIDYTGSQYIAGARAGSYQTTLEFAINGSGSRTDWDIRFTTSQFYGQTYGVSDRNDHKWRSKVSMTNGTGYWEITDLDELTTKKISFSNKTVTASSNLMLFAYNGSTIHNNLRIYSCKIYDNTTLVRDFIPCYRKTDNVAGMYDLVNDVFYTNAGTGTFIVGDDISYEKLSYIESSGTQYIDTGIIPNQNTGFDVVYETNDELVGGNTGYGAILGARENSKVNELQLTTYTQDGSGLAGTLRFGNTDNNAGITSGVKMRSILKNQIYTNNSGVMYELNGISFASPVSLTVFALNNNGTATQFGKLKLYSLKIYDSNTLIRDFIPCRCSNNKFGLFDRVQKRFYTNAGTDEFIAEVT